jgi:uncharacterized membrane protein YhaH (DUF805 family)
MNKYFNEYKNVLSNYANFDGRATVREFWSFWLINSAAGLLLALLVPPLAALVALAVLLPGTAVGVRRLHDQNRSGWLVLIGLIPFGVVVLLAWAAQRGTSGSNDYGPDPSRQPGGEAPRPPSAPSGYYDFECSVCGSGVPRGAKLCPSCEASFNDPDTDAKPVDEELSEIADADPVVSSSLGIGAVGRLGLGGLDPEVKRLREELAVKERFVAERLAERREAEEAEKREAEVERQIAELGARIAEVDEQVAELTPYAKVCKVVCPMCGEMSPFPYDVCPQCFKPQTNQDSRLKMYRCGKCGCVCGETDKSCSLCGAEFAD